MGMQIVPTFVAGEPWEFYEGIVNAMLLALVLLSVLGVFFPLLLLPVLFWEILWKAAWIVSVAVPMARGDGMDEDTLNNLYACALALIFVVAMPWRYILEMFKRTTV